MGEEGVGRRKKGGGRIKNEGQHSELLSWRAEGGGRSSSGDIAQLAECLYRLHRAYSKDYIELGMVLDTYTFQYLGDQRFKVILGCLPNLKSCWATWNPVFRGGEKSRKKSKKKVIPVAFEHRMLAGKFFFLAQVWGKNPETSLCVPYN